jgi:4-amino-4-deoxy-L-arabinose transferase-like glycosyltransferase
MKNKSMLDKYWVLIIAFSIFFLTSLNYPLLNHDESRYAEIPREMVASNEYVVPRLNGVIYLEKPPLFYWLQALSIKLFGVNEGAVRFWNAFFAAFTCMMVYLAGNALYDRRTGIMAALFLSSSVLFFAMAHFVSLDMTLSAFVTGCLFCLLFGLHRQSHDLQRRMLFYGAYVFGGLGLMTKGLVGIALPGCVFVLWMIATRQFSILKHIYLPSGLAIFLAIILPWHLVMQSRIPEFFDFYVIGQHFSRYLTMSENRYEPIWFFMPVLLIGLLPGTFFVCRALYRSIQTWRFDFKGKSADTFLWLWIIVVFVFFSLSKSKLIPYILPILPPIILLFTKDVCDHTRSCRAWIATAVIAMVVYACIIPFWSNYVDRSIKPLAMIINQQKGQYDELASFGQYYQDLPFYTQQLVTVVNSQGELDFGMTLEDKTGYMINQKIFLKRWNDPHHRMLVILSHKKFKKIEPLMAKKPVVFSETSRHMLIANQ